MRIRETIKKVLSEEIEYEEKYGMMSDFIDTFYPFFKKDKVDIRKRKIANRYYIIYFFGPNVGGDATMIYNEDLKELQLSQDIFNTLDNYFGEDMDVVLDWFNTEFGLDAEHVTF